MSTLLKMISGVLALLVGLSPFGRLFVFSVLTIDKPSGRPVAASYGGFMNKVLRLRLILIQFQKNHQAI
jgi:hypothetical protein